MPTRVYFSSRSTFTLRSLCISSKGSRRCTDRPSAMLTQAGSCCYSTTRRTRWTTWPTCKWSACDSRHSFSSAGLSKRQASTWRRSRRTKLAQRQHCRADPKLRLLSTEQLNYYPLSNEYKPEMQPSFLPPAEASAMSYAQKTTVTFWILMAWDQPRSKVWQHASRLLFELSMKSSILDHRILK